ncbi:MAG: zinc-binding dehydrogenase [Acidimicrobiaceae bacterium]|nr:zinc-binding dehydrogenase [Acidimicrobiaceae bacterium]
MRAVRYRVHGGAEVLETVELPARAAAPGQVVVAVRAVGVNRLDVLQRAGPPLLPGFGLPHIPGMDIAGVVVERGPGVTTVETGTRVVVKPGVHCGTCAMCQAGDDRHCPAVRVVGGSEDGGYAEQCEVPASHVFPIPDHISFTEAATVPTACSTAWRALFGTGELRLGETVVIHGAGSGVSVIALQLAKRAGANVVVTSRSDEKLERSLALGADLAVNHRTDDLVAAVERHTDGRGADMVVDHVGPALFGASLRCLRPRGRLVVCGTTTGAEVTVPLPQLYHRGIKLLGVDSQSYAEFVDMLEFYWRGGFEAVVDSELPLEDAADAHRRMEKGDVFGKLVLRP